MTRRHQYAEFPKVRKPFSLQNDLQLNPDMKESILLIPASKIARKSLQNNLIQFHQQPSTFEWSKGTQWEDPEAKQFTLDAH